MGKLNDCFFLVHVETVRSKSFVADAISDAFTHQDKFPWRTATVTPLDANTYIDEELRQRKRWLARNSKRKAEMKR